jgi:CheY-like chemotaxis protein
MKNKMKNKKNNGVLQTEESAGAQARCQATPSNRILVVDDDVDIRQANAEVLRRFGYQTETAADGAAAWETLQANSYDLLITDNNMPKVSGVELVKKVRSAHMTLPVILASGTLPTEELDRNPWLQPVATLVKAFSTGQLLETRYWRICVRSKWLVKPFSSGQLLETVNEVLSQPTVPAPHGNPLFR